MHPSAGTRFPLLAAAVDVGSNAIRFAAARFEAPGVWTVLESSRAPVRVGRGVFTDGLIGRDATEAAAEALAGFARRMRDLGVDRYRAVATSAVRESADRERFVAQVAERSGIRVEVIDGAEEARLGWVAVRTRLPLREAPWLVVDLGGGSLEVSLMDGSGIGWSESRRIGAVRMLQSVPASGVEEVERLQAFVRSELGGLLLPATAEPPRGLAALGGNAEALAKLAGIVPDARGVSTLPVARLRAVREELAPVAPAQRAERFGLAPDRGDVVLPAAVVYEHLADLAGVREVHVPHVGVKEGILVDIVENAHRGGAE